MALTGQSFLFVTLWGLRATHSGRRGGGGGPPPPRAGAGAEPLVRAAMTEAVSDAMQGGTAAVEPVVLPAHETTPQEPDFDAMYQELHAEAKSAEIDPETLEVSDHVVGVDFD